MSFQTDMIWEFAKFLETEYQKKDYEKLEIRVKNRVSLNERKVTL